MTKKESSKKKSSKGRSTDRSMAEENLIDLKGDIHPDLCVGIPAIMNNDHRHESKDDLGDDDSIPSTGGNMDFNKLRFIEKPLEDLSLLPQTLAGCVGCMDGLPLRPPNADQSDPNTIVDMINSVMNLELLFPSDGSSPFSDRTGGATSFVPKKTIHARAPGAVGHTVRPGCISLYQQFGTVYACPEGTWYLPSFTAHWMKGYSNITLDQAFIRTEDNQVLIIRIIEGQVGLITVQGVHHLLDVGTHVFNTGTVSISHTF